MMKFYHQSLKRFARALSRHEGFTLIELLVVIAIIGILAGVVLVSLNSARVKSRDARRIADVKQVVTALEIFYNSCSAYPTLVSPASIEGLGLGTGVVGDCDPAVPVWTSPPLDDVLLANVPLAPLPEDGSCTPTDNSYTYSSADGTTFELSFCLGGGVDSYGAGTHTASPAGIQ